ncbi:MAG: 30S ribosomal protein S5 [Conexivisphaerales archaeon]|nr:30S ribosomal protein S5 [Conexivisphaerales archaeon]
MSTSRGRQRREAKEWVPRTKVGRAVQEGKLTSLSEIFEAGLRVKEAEIVRKLLPDLKQEVLGIRIVQKQTESGEVTRFSAIVAVGSPGWLGLGHAKAYQMRDAIDKATNVAMLNIVPVHLGCGSWECRCGRPHSVPYKLVGKAGSVTVEIIPGPRGLGLVADDVVKKLLALAGLQDAWTRSFGMTSTLLSKAQAVYNAFRDMHAYSDLRRFEG